ncbi:MAG: hypothetical protein J0M08_13215 [Bacteroidetes bacterium]|nr:hypothetical protein [Bacteroidota bacterium]
MSSKHKKISTNSPKQNFNWIALALILLFTAIVFSSSIKGDWLYNWDDNLYILNSPNVFDFSIKGIFSEYEVDNYHPLTTLSYAIQYKFGGLNAASFHLWNLIIHLLNVFLVYRLFFLLVNNWKVSAITALLFAVHPMRVESVAWISERKDVLYVFFYLWSIVNYVLYKLREKKKYLAYCLLLFLCSLLSKSAAVSLSVMLLVVDYFIDKKINAKAIVDKWPFFVLSLVFGIVAIHSQGLSGAIRVAPEFSLLDRFFITNYNLGFYLFKYFIPTDLSVIYLYPQKIDGWLPWFFYASPVVLMLFALLSYWFKTSRSVLLFSFGFYLVGLMLVLQLIPVGRAITADRYSYLPHIGISFLIGIVYVRLEELFKKNKPIIPKLYLYSLVLFAIACMWLTTKQVKVWQDSLTVTTNAIEQNEGNYLYKDFIYASRGVAKDKLEDYASAILDYDKSLEYNPTYYQVYYNRALDKEKIKDLSGALADYSKAVEVNPSYAKAYFSRGTLKINTSDLAGAIQDFDLAIKYDANMIEAYNNRGGAKYMNNQKEEGCNDWKIAAAKGFKNSQENIVKYCK